MDTDIHKKNGRVDTHKFFRQKIIDIIETYDVTNIWRDKNPSLMQYTWHSSHKPPIFCRLDYFLISKNISNIVIFVSIKPFQGGTAAVVHIYPSYFNNEFLLYDFVAT